MVALRWRYGGVAAALRRYGAAQAKRQLGEPAASALGSDDGLFWMSVHDFCAYFCGVAICRDNPGWRVGPSPKPSIRYLSIHLSICTICLFIYLHLCCYYLFYLFVY